MEINWSEACKKLSIVIRELKTLVAVARFGAFAAAGERIGLTQAAVSGHIRRLEEELGFALFDRTGRSATLNAAGQRTLERARELIAGYDALKEPGGESAAREVRIGAIASVQATIIPRAAALFRERHPGRRIHIAPGVSLNLIDMIDGGELDLVVVIRPSFGIPKTIVWRPLVREPFMLAVPASMSGNDWRGLVGRHPFIRYERASLGGRQVERFLNSHGVSVRESIEADDIAALLALVAEGLGVALFPATEACRPLPASVRAVSLGDDAFHREIGFMTSLATEPAVERFGDCLLAVAGN
jgi:DNA-binding transcriptional LysR family regulator